MPTTDISTGKVLDDGLGDALKIGGDIVNFNDSLILQKIADEKINTDNDLEIVARTNLRNKFSGNIMFQDYQQISDAVANLTFVTGSPDFYLTNTGDITLNNPLDVVNNKIQRGIIVSVGQIMSVGAYWRYGNVSPETGISIPIGVSDTDSTSYAYYVYMYAQLNTTNVMLSFLGGSNNGL